MPVLRSISLNDPRTTRRYRGTPAGGRSRPCFPTPGTLPRAELSRPFRPSPGARRNWHPACAAPERAPVSAFPGLALRQAQGPALSGRYNHRRVLRVGRSRRDRRGCHYWIPTFAGMTTGVGAGRRVANWSPYRGSSAIFHTRTPTTRTPATPGTLPRAELSRPFRPSPGRGGSPNGAKYPGPARRAGRRMQDAINGFPRRLSAHFPVADPTKRVPPEKNGVAADTAKETRGDVTYPPSSTQRFR